jgi:hypothetical protein
MKLLLMSVRRTKNDGDDNKILKPDVLLIPLLLSSYFVGCLPGSISSQIKHKQHLFAARFSALWSADDR